MSHLKTSLWMTTPSVKVTMIGEGGMGGKKMRYERQSHFEETITSWGELVPFQGLNKFGGRKEMEGYHEKREKTKEG